jgi:hypothetical protein
MLATENLNNINLQLQGEDNAMLVELLQTSFRSQKVGTVGKGLTQSTLLV